VRIAVLREAIRLGANYVDVELDSVERIGERGDTGLIVSHHDVQEMPADFPGLWGELRASGADVVKLVGTAREAAETAPILETLARADVPTIAIAMGGAGLASRVLALRYDACFLTYSALGEVAGTAPGQLTVAELVEMYRGRELGPATEAIGVLGPELETQVARGYNATLRAGGVDLVAVPLLVPEGGDAVGTIAALRGLGFRGFEITPPHQETVGQGLDALDRSACRAGKVNLIYRQGDGLVGAWVEGGAQRIDRFVSGASGFGPS
jgi:3-dehydroquinate dehydratase / shikimate dehydrogenase